MSVRGRAYSESTCTRNVEARRGARRSGLQQASARIVVVHVGSSCRAGAVLDLALAPQLDVPRTPHTPALAGVGHSRRSSGTDRLTAGRPLPFGRHRAMGRRRRGRTGDGLKRSTSARVSAPRLPPTCPWIRLTVGPVASPTLARAHDAQRRREGKKGVGLYKRLRGGREREKGRADLAHHVLTHSAPPSSSTLLPLAQMPIATSTGPSPTPFGINGFGRIGACRSRSLPQSVNPLTPLSSPPPLAGRAAFRASLVRDDCEGVWSSQLTQRRLPS